MTATTSTKPRAKILITRLPIEGIPLRGKTFRVGLQFENIGDAPVTPQIVSMSFALPRSTINFGTPPFLESLNPKAPPVAHTFSITPEEEGLGWLALGVTDVTNGGRNDIECYQVRDAPFTLNQWGSAIYVGKPEDYRMIELLEIIAKMRQGGM